jgi:hypothetical protein
MWFFSANTSKESAERPATDITAPDALSNKLFASIGLLHGSVNQ